MAIVLTKPKTKTEEQQKQISEIAAMADAIGEMLPIVEKANAQIKKLQDSLKPYAQAVAALQKKVDELQLGDDETLVDAGLNFQAEIGARGNAREITSIDKVRELMGDEVFFKCASVTLKDIDAYLTLPQREECLKTNRTKRSVKVTKVEQLAKKVA